ncbi:MAG: fibronectin type III domain-containing protein, partial [Thermodesulfovibrionales bacterium]
QINLSWSDTTNETGYRIYRNTQNLMAGTPISLSAGSTSYSATSLSASTTYYYWVEAYNANGSASASCNATTPTPGGGTPPAAPASLTCTVASSTQINLSWSDTTNETGYRIYRNTQNLMTGTPISLSAGSTSYSATALSASTTYYYWVEAYNANGSASASCNATTPAAPGGGPTPGDGTTYSTPQLITPGTAVMAIDLAAGATRYYTFSVPTTAAGIEFGMAQVYQRNESNCNVVIATSNTAIDQKYTAAMAFYAANGGAQVGWTDSFRSPTAWAQMAGTSGETVSISSPFPAYVLYVKIKNEGTLKQQYNLNVTVK